LLSEYYPAQTAAWGLSALTGGGRRADLLPGHRPGRPGRSPRGGGHAGV